MIRPKLQGCYASPAEKSWRPDLKGCGAGMETKNCPNHSVPLHCLEDTSGQTPEAKWIEGSQSRPDTLRSNYGIVPRLVFDYVPVEGVPHLLGFRVSLTKNEGLDHLKVCHQSQLKTSLRKIVFITILVYVLSRARDHNPYKTNYSY